MTVTLSTVAAGFVSKEQLETSFNQVQWEDLRFPAQGINPAGQAAPPAVDNGETAPGTLLFDQNEWVAGVAQMPHAWLCNSTIVPHVHWTKTTTTAGSVAWSISYSMAKLGAKFAAMSTAATGTAVIAYTTVPETHYMDNFPVIVPTNHTSSVSSMLIWKIGRVDGGSDNYPSEARLLEVDFHYKTDSRGSNAITTKQD